MLAKKQNVQIVSNANVEKAALCKLNVGPTYVTHEFDYDTRVTYSHQNNCTLHFCSKKNTKNKKMGRGGQ